jgi:hypothetical protein
VHPKSHKTLGLAIHSNAIESTLQRLYTRIEGWIKINSILFTRINPFAQTGDSNRDHWIENMERYVDIVCREIDATQVLALSPVVVRESAVVVHAKLDRRLCGGESFHSSPYALLYYKATFTFSSHIWDIVTNACSYLLKVGEISGNIRGTFGLSRTP